MALGAGLGWPRPRALGWGLGQARGQGPREGVEDRGGGPRYIYGVLLGGLATPKRGRGGVALEVCLSLPWVCLNQLGYIAVVPCALGGSF